MRINTLISLGYETMLLREMFKETLMEEMTPKSALDAFGLNFEQFSNMSQDDLKKKWRELVRANHPDLPQNRGKDDITANINAAYDYLKNYRNNQSQTDDPLKPQPFRRSTAPYPKPPWQPDDSYNNKIHVETYRDVNYIKKHIWELSDKSKEIWNVAAFDDGHFGGRFNVYGSSHVFGEMAKAMRIYHANGGKDITQAVFASTSDKPNQLFMIYCNGIDLSMRPIPIDYKGNSPYSDKNMISKLPEIINKITDLYSRYRK
jgi:hypothetical protein